MTKTTSPARFGRWLALAACAGVASGLGAVYVMGGGAGNAQAAACAGSLQAAAALRPHATGEVAAMRPLEEAAPLADLAFSGPDGERMTLADLAGKTVLLNLWATWCGPCRAEMPALDRLEAAEGGDGFEVVAVNIDIGGAERPLEFLEEIGVGELAFYADHSMDIYNTLRSRGLAVGMPTTLLIDEEGCGLGVLHGPAEWDTPDAVALIEAARSGS